MLGTTFRCVLFVTYEENTVTGHQTRFSNGNLCLLAQHKHETTLKSLNRFLTSRATTTRAADLKDRFHMIYTLCFILLHLFDLGPISDHNCNDFSVKALSIYSVEHVLGATLLKVFPEVCSEISLADDSRHEGRKENSI